MPKRTFPCGRILPHIMKSCQSSIGEGGLGSSWGVPFEPRSREKSHEIQQLNNKLNFKDGLYLKGNNSRKINLYINIHGESSPRCPQNGNGAKGEVTADVWRMERGRRGRKEEEGLFSSSLFCLLLSSSSFGHQSPQESRSQQGRDWPKTLFQEHIHSPLLCMVF